MKTQRLLFARVSIVILSVFFTLALPMMAAAQQKIAFSTDRNGNSEIYLMNANGTDPVNLTHNPAFDIAPSLSPKGNRIAFTSQRNGRFDVYTMNLDGSNQTNLTNNIGTSNFHPSYSWDGNKIVFVSNNSNGTAEILMMNADGSNPVFLGSTQFARDPAFSPDGSKVIFGGNVFGQYDIYVVSTAGSNPVPLAGSQESDFEPSFSPDGNKIVFTTNRDGNEEIYVMNADGTNQVRLTQNAGVDTAPVFSPDGSKIAFSSDRPGGWDIYVMNSDGTNQVPITNSPGFSNTSPSWADLTFAPPAFINLDMTPEINEGGTATLSGDISSFDPGQNITLTVSWGDGSPQQDFVYDAGTTSFTETHQYRDNLFDVSYTAAVQLTTANGSDIALVDILVLNVAPNLTVNQPSPNVIGSPLALNGNVFDPGTLDTHVVQINWGDGSPNSTLNLASGVTNFSSNHTYAALGRYTIAVTATDDDGGSAAPVNVFVGVVPPPTSGKIAFTSNFAGNNNIYLMNSNGTGPVALTTNPASDSYPDLSTDGSKVVFISDRDGNPEIYTMNSAGAFQKRLTSTAGTESEPVFSPDGSKIAFSSNRDGNHEIYIMNADGTGQTRLTTNTVDDGQAEFSPDGTKIVFSRLAANQSDAHIITMDLTGANQVPLTSGSFVLNGYPSYSPNGQKIVFSRANLSHTNAEIYVMDANGGNAVRLTTAGGQDLEAAFSPNGSKIAFRSERDGNAEIYLMDANGANQQRITFDGPGITNIAPSWSDVSIINIDIPDDLAREQGSTLVVPIIVSDTTGKGILSYDFALNYDPAVLEPIDPAGDKAGTLSGSFEVNAGAAAPGRLSVSGFGTNPLSGAGTLLLLKFNVIGTPPTSSDLTLDPFTFNEGIPFANVSAGRVFIQGTIRGRVTYGTSSETIGVPDVDLLAAGSPDTSTSTELDGTYVLGGFGPGAYTVTPSKTGDNSGISALDASLISQFLVGQTSLTANQQTAGEVSGNGTLTSFDAALIAQYVIGLPNPGRAGEWRFVPQSRSYLTVASLTGEDYSAVLLGEVSGNWATSFAAQLNEKEREIALSESRRPPKFRVTATLPSMKVKRGQLIEIPIAVSFSRSIVPIKAYQFDLIYDPSVLQPDTAPVETAGTVSQSLNSVANSLQAGRLRVALYGAGSFNAGGSLLILKFRTIGPAGSASPLAFEGLMFNEGDPAAEGRSGSVAIRR